MTSTIDAAGPPADLDDRATAGPATPSRARPGRRFGLRRRPVTRTVRGRRTVVVPAERLSPAELAQRVPFVVVLLLLIGAGVGGTLLLSAQTTQDTYDLKNARDANVALVERMESLQASNERARSAEALATRAEKLGMVGGERADPHPGFGWCDRDRRRARGGTRRADQATPACSGSVRAVRVVGP